MGKKLTIEFVRESFEKEGYELLSKEYINAQSKKDRNWHKAWYQAILNKRYGYVFNN